ncbi:hypothetical protein SDC9_56592 [bioreactor metagenome]|uniref:Uncharacterized protein n=1 Tax=bioreactor metagenome TaxID=1076179 RepID=A0A644X7Z4_9ZZZZ
MTDLQIRRLTPGGVGRERCQHGIRTTSFTRPVRVAIAGRRAVRELLKTLGMAVPTAGFHSWPATAASTTSGFVGRGCVLSAERGGPVQGEGRLSDHGAYVVAIIVADGVGR